MKLKIKDEYLDIMILDPLTRRNLHTWFIDPDLYEYYYHNGYDIIFDIIEEENKKKNK